MADATPSFEVGDRVGKFRVLDRLGSGTTGEVLLAEQPIIRRKVALKVLTRADAGRTARFHEEARKLALLDHPNIVELYDVCEHDGFPYMVLEYVEGSALSELAAGADGITAPVLLRIAATVARALEHAHSWGVIHKDLKPANIIVGHSGEPVLCDLSPSPLVTGDAELDSRRIVGTPGYMSPEQARGEALTPRTDIWGLGATLFALLAGRPPYEAAGAPGPVELAKLVELTASDRPVDLSPLEGRAPACVAAVVERCLRKAPERRYRSADSLRRAVEAAIDYVEASHDETVAVPPPQEGQTLLLHVERREPELRGKFREFEIVSYVGGGAFGDIYRATERLTGRTVALKVLRRSVSSDEDAVARFRREATLLSRVEHPNVVRLYSFGRYGSSFFLAMEFLEGQPLDELMGESIDERAGERTGGADGADGTDEAGDAAAGPMDLREAAGIVEQILSGLAAVHAAGVVHRDVKPGNVVLVGEGGDGREGGRCGGEGRRAVLCDFGLATAPDMGRVTSTGLVLGSPSYMAPETARGEATTAASDVHAAGAVLYEMLAGRLPHTAGTTRRLLRDIAHTPPEPVGRWRPGLPEAVGDLVRAMLAMDPAGRPPAAEARERLLQAVGT